MSPINERRRSRNEIRIAILRFCLHEYKKISHINAAVNTWHKLLKEDLAYLESHNLLDSRVFGKYDRWHTTDEGRQVLKEWKKLYPFLYGRDYPFAPKNL